MPAKRYFFLLPFILLFFLVTSESVERSMYTDGVAYAGLSMNMANGVGTFWNPKLSEVHHFSFHEHPPLVFGVQSLFFRVFGDSIVTERLYALFMLFASGYLLVLLWRLALVDHPKLRALWFLPLTVWLINEVVYHFYPANVLEPTMTLFTLIAVGCCVMSVRAGGSPGRQAAFVAAAGFSVLLATLCKGFVALFPLGFYAAHYLIFRKQSLGKAVLCTLGLVGMVGLGYLALWSHEPARLSLTRYFDSQVMASLLSERSFENHHRGSRWYIIEKCALITLPYALIAALLVGVAYWRGYRPDWTSTPFKWGYVFLLIGAMASLPLAVSPKQSFYYLLPSMAYYALGFSLVAAGAMGYFWQRPTGPRSGRFIKWGALLLLAVAIGNTLTHWGKVNNRDRVVLHDLDALGTVVPEGATVGALGDVRELVSYGYREHRLSLDTTVSQVQDYDFIVSPLTYTNVPSDYRAVPLGTEKFGVYRREVSAQ